MDIQDTIKGIEYNQKTQAAILHEVQVEQSKIKNALYGMEKNVIQPLTYTKKQAALYVGVEQITIADWIRKGKIIGYKSDRLVLINRKSLEDYINSLPKPYPTTKTNGNN